MTHPKHSNSSFRYLMAGLKPLASLKLWGSLGIMTLVAVALWQYSLHPEWLGKEPVTGSNIDGEFEGQVGNNVDIGVTVQDLEQNRLNSQGVPVGPPAVENNPFLFPSIEGNKKGLQQQQRPSIKFEPLMPNVKNLGSLFPPLQPSKNKNQPIEIPDDLENIWEYTENTALENALEEVFSEDLPEVNSSNTSPKNNQQPNNPNPNPSSQPNAQTAPNTVRNTPYSNQPYTQPNHSRQPFNNPYTYNSPQPYSQPYGNGTAPGPVQVSPPSAQSPNNYPTVNSNPNYPSAANENQSTPNYGIQPPQINQDGNMRN